MECSDQPSTTWFCYGIDVTPACHGGLSEMWCVAPVHGRRAHSGVDEAARGRPKLFQCSRRIEIGVVSVRRHTDHSDNQGRLGPPLHIRCDCARISRFQLGEKFYEIRRSQCSAVSPVSCPVLRRTTRDCFKRAQTRRRRSASSSSPTRTVKSPMRSSALH